MGEPYEISGETQRIWKNTREYEIIRENVVVSKRILENLGEFGLFYTFELYANSTRN